LNIELRQTPGQAAEPMKVLVDGNVLSGESIPLTNDESTHEVTVHLPVLAMANR
jgi:hypothetical protein